MTRPHHPPWLCVLVLGIFVTGTCKPTELEPLPEAVVFVDTDLPVPRAAARLRIDLYDETGRWFDTRDVSRPTRADWPASFSVYTNVERASRVYVRLRAYPEGAIRDDRGERFVDWGEQENLAGSVGQAPLEQG